MKNLNNFTLMKIENELYETRMILMAPTIFFNCLPFKIILSIN